MTLVQQGAHSYGVIDKVPQRAATLSFVAVLHAAVLYAFLTALGVVPMPTIPMPFIGSVIPDDRVIPPPPPPPQPTIEAPRLTETAPPIIEVPLEPAGPNAITPTQTLPQTVPERPAASEPPASPPTIVITPARAIAWTHTIPDYPAISRRLGEQGTLRLKLAIAADGTVSDARVEASSGYQRLDEAAVQWVKTHWRYEPAMQGTKPMPSSALAEVTFKLK
ncbi:MAG TPA: energy transducer TonB [Micropepsaceae bacterium]|nr:energy transducer TonB [Micropepsaceae bacterium]